MVSSTNQTKDEKQKLAARLELANGPLKRKLGMLEHSIPDGSDWIVPPSLSIADIAIWRVLGWFTSGLLDGMPKDLLADFPKIRRVCLAVDQHPKVQEWIGRTYPENYVRGTYLLENSNDCFFWTMISAGRMFHQTRCCARS